MTKALKFLLLLGSLMLSMVVFGQDDKPKEISYSFSYLPPSFGISHEDFTLLPFYVNFQANVQLKPFDRISFSSGLGYFQGADEIPSYYKNKVSGLSLPLQANYHLVKSPQKTDSYIKAIYTNGLWFFNNIDYEDDGTSNTTNTTKYYPSIGLGVGAVFRKHKKVGILLEGMIEKYLRNGDFTNTTLFSLKIGVVI